MEEEKVEEDGSVIDMKYNFSSNEEGILSRDIDKPFSRSNPQFLRFISRFSIGYSKWQLLSLDNGISKTWWAR